MRGALRSNSDREAALGKTARTGSRDQGRGRSDATDTVATRGRETLKNTSTARGARRLRSGGQDRRSEAKRVRPGCAVVELLAGSYRVRVCSDSRRPGSSHPQTSEESVTSRVDGPARAPSTRSHRPTPRGRVALVAPVDRLRSDVSGRPPRPGRPRSNGGLGSPRGAETLERSLDRDGRDG
jgi:hypothetical protein